MNKDMENTFNQMAELCGSDERLGTNTTPFINAPLLPKNTRPAPAATDTGLVRYDLSMFGNGIVEMGGGAYVRADQAEKLLAAERAESDEAYELGKRDGYSEAVQEIDLKTGGDGEYRYCTDHDPDRHTPDPASMIQRIAERFETLNTMESISEINEWKERAEKAEADNAALTERIKELTRNLEFADLHCGNEIKRVTELEAKLAAANKVIDRLSDELNDAEKEACDTETALMNEQVRAETAETKLAAAQKALEPFAAHANYQAVDDTGWRDKETVKIVVSFGDLRKARAVLGGKS